MTTGNKYHSTPYLVFTPPGFGPITLYETRSRVWSGQDSIKPTAPRSSFPTEPRKVRRAKRPRKKRIFPDNPYSLTVTHVREGWWRAAFPNKTVSGYKAPQNITLLKSQVYTDPKQEYKAIEKIQNRFFGSGFAPAVFAAETPQALKMIRDSAIRLGALIHSLRYRDRAGVEDALGTRTGNPRWRYDGFFERLADRRRGVSSLFLELQYGWRPILQDAEDGAQYLAQALEGQIPGKVSVRKVWSQTWVTPSRAYSLYWECLRVKFSLQYIIHGQGLSASRLPNLYTAAEVVWEKIPYSFVADWFVPVGSYVSALKTAASLSGCKVVRSLKREYEFDTIRCGATSGGQPPVSFVNAFGDSFHREIDFSRTVSDGLSVPNPLAHLEGDLSLSVERTANAVALLTQRNWSGLASLLKPLPRDRHGKLIYTE